MKYIVKFDNYKIEMTAKTTTEAAQKAMSNNYIGNECPTITVEWNHRLIEKQESKKDDVFNGMLATIPSFVACKSELFFWDSEERRVVPENKTVLL